MNRQNEAGFSLVELMVAMVVTVVISGAVYGLILSGNTAFKRDPAQAERQQNIRVAMDVITRDIQTAGTRMGPFAQVFTQALDGVGIASMSGQTDALALVGDAGACPDMPVGNPPLDQAAFTYINLAMPVAANSCLDRAPLLLVYGAAGGAWGFIDAAGPTATPTGANGTSTTSFTACGAGSDIRPCLTAAGVGPTPVGISAANVVRYEVANIPNDQDNLGNPVPGLYRSTTGGIPTAGGAVIAAPGAGGNWQLVARGIEDLQVEYQTNDLIAAAAPGWTGNAGAPLVVNGNFGSIVHEVRVTLRARAINLEGSVQLGVMAQRGDLTSVSVVRSALLYMVGNGWL
jgi:type IV pilus assembly protein PilW